MIDHIKRLAAQNKTYRVVCVHGRTYDVTRTINTSTNTLYAVAADHPGEVAIAIDKIIAIVVNPTPTPSQS